tara:strand:+ start:4017 stop:4253 length:237 start_codon:yes stop_codon:yes gene_type:complete
MELLKDIKDIIFNNDISEPVVMRSAGGWYIGRVYNENGFMVPYDRLTEYMSKEDAIALLDDRETIRWYYARLNSLLEQ